MELSGVYRTSHVNLIAARPAAAVVRPRQLAAQVPSISIALTDGLGCVFLDPEDLRMVRRCGIGCASSYTRIGRDEIRYIALGHLLKSNTTVRLGAARPTHQPHVTQSHFFIPACY